MNATFPKTCNRLAVWVLVIGLTTLGVISSQAQGIGFQLVSTNYSTVMGNPTAGSVSIQAIPDPYNVVDDSIDDGDYGFTDYGYYDGDDFYNYIADWALFDFDSYGFDASADVSLYDSDDNLVDYQTITWRGLSGNGATESFSFSDPNPGTPGPDFVGYVYVDNFDPTWSEDDGYAEFCYPFIDDGYGYYSSVYVYSQGTVTNLNPNTTMNIQVVGSTPLTEGAAPDAATIQIYRADSYNTRTVHYAVSGNAVNGGDYTAPFTGSTGTVTIAAGSTSANIDISTLENADLMDLDEPSTLTITLSDDTLHSYQIGANNSASITFQNEPVEIGTASLTRSTSPSFEDQNIGLAKNGNSPVSRSYINNLYSSSSAIVSVFATAPYASSSGPTPGEFTVTRGGYVSNSFSLSFTVSGTATAGTNYTALPTAITFAANQTSTNLLVNVLTNAVLTNAQTVVLSLNTNSSYFLGYSTQAVVTILPLGATTNSVPAPAGRYVRGSGSNPTYWSQVIPLDAETGTMYSNLNGNCSSLYPLISSWSSPTLYHYNATNALSQTITTNRLAFNNPIVAFGERIGGTPLYYSQNYSFGIYAGDPVRSNLPVVIQAYYRTNLQLAGTINLLPPNYFNTNSMVGYAANGFEVTTNGFGLTTTLSDSPGLSWGTTSLGAYVLTQNATSQATNYYYLVEVAGYPADGTNAMVTATNGGVAAASLLYTLEFEARPAWRSIFLDQPQFAGSPLPPYYAGMTLAEKLTNTPPVTNAVTVAPSAATNLDDSPEERRHPILDSFVASMGNDPIALANYVINSIDLTDPMGYSDNGNLAEQSIDPGGVSRDALGVFMEKQGSAVEQCALLVYLLRQAGVPAVYEFAPRNGVQMLDARLSQLLKFQIQGAVNEAGQLYTTNTMIPVNYPWVAAYIGTNWVHIFPWLKDYEITEGFNLWDYMPSNYPSAYPWVHDYVYGNSNLLSLAVNGDNTPRVIFPAYLQQTLLQNYPGISVDDIGVQILDRQHYYARWQDFPTPTWVTNVSFSLTNLTCSGITNISPTLTNVFDTVSVEVYSLSKVTNNIQTGTLRLCDLHNREFYIYQAITNTANTNLVQLSLILAPFRTNITSQYNFANDTNLLSREVLSMTLGTNETQLNVNFLYQRHRSLSASYPVNPATTFAGINAVETVSLARPLLKGDQAAICLDYGRVTQDMLNVYATDLWQMEDELKLTPSLTNSLSPDVYLGVPMYLAGLSYYKEVSDFAAQNENLNKINILSTWAVGLSKISAARDQYGNLTNGVDPVLPNVDMAFYQTTEVGNGTVQPNSNQTLEMAQQNFDLISILDNSAEEHRVINHFYGQTNAVSTVRLLQLSQADGQGIVALNYSNYVGQGLTAYQGAPLANWDPNLWSQVTAAFQNAYDGNYTTAYITPGPMTNSAYSGMGALILGWGQWQALITPQSLNGAFGEPLAEGAMSPDNTVNVYLDGDGDFVFVTTAPGTDTVLAPNVSAAIDYSTTLAQILDGQDAITSFDSLWGTQVNNDLNVPATGTPAQTTGDALQASSTQAYLGNPTYVLSQQYTGSSDPVQNITGEHYIDATDLQLAGPFPLTMRRNYSSQNLADNGLGTGWKISLMPYLSVATGGTNIYAADMDGAVLAYVQTATNASVWLPTMAANPGLNNNTTAGVGGLVNRLRDRLVLTVSGSTSNYTLYGADGSTRNFQVQTFNNGVLIQTRPYLQKWTDSRGNYYLFTFGTNSSQPNFGQVVRIQSSNGNYLGLDYDVNNHVIDAFCGDGREIFYAYDYYGDLVTVTLPDTTTLSYIYQHATQAITNGVATYSTHLLIEEDKPDGRVLQNFYDNQRRVTNQLSTAGANLIPIRTATFVYANNFNITNSSTNAVSGYTLLTDGDSHTTRFDYTNSLITKITDPLNQTVQQTWYPDNATAPGYPRSLQQTIDKRGLVTRYQYDGNGDVTNALVTGDLTGDGITTQTATNTAVYNTNCLPVQMTDPAGNGTMIVYDPVFNFLPQQIIRFAGTTPVSTNFMYYGNATNVVVDGSRLQTNLAFGLMTREIRAWNTPDTATNDTVYSGNGFPTETIRYSGTGDPNVTNTFFYNERGQVVNQVDALGAVTLYNWDAMNRPIEQENFDEYGNALSWNFIYYTDNGDVSWTEGPRYNPENDVYYDYDGAGRRTTEIHWRSQANSTGTGVTTPSGYNLYAQTFYEYDPNGNLLLKVDPRGAMTTNIFDSLNRLVQTVHLETNEVSVLSEDEFSYEPGGLVQSHTNALGGITTTLYNITGKPEFRSNADGSTNAWRYYLDGRIHREIQGNGAYWQTTYDDVNRITTRTFYSAAGVAEVSNSVQFDRRGNVIQRVDEGLNAFTTTRDGMDRVKISTGPGITTVSSVISNVVTGIITYTTNTMQQVNTNFYDAAGRAMTNINALGEMTVTRMDALGRVTTNWVFSSSGALVREQYTAYSADHNSVTVTDGSGATAISHTTWTDCDGRTVLAIAYPAANTTDFTLNQFDLAGNLISAQHDSALNGIITNWTTTRLTYDGLNRVVQMANRDNAVTTNFYDSLSDQTNRSLPGGLQWQASYNSAGQILQEQIAGGGNTTRTNVYVYYSSSSSFAGLLQTKTDGRGSVGTYSYDDQLRTLSITRTDPIYNHDDTFYSREPRGYVTNITEQYTGNGTGNDPKVILRSFDAYGQLASETVTLNGATVSSASQSWNAAGRRTGLAINGTVYNFGSRADGALISASDTTVGGANGSGAYGFDTAGILTSRTVGNRLTAVTSRDGEGRPLIITNTVNTMSELAETLAWSGDGLLTSDTLVRADFTDNRSYAYANLSRRVIQEQQNLNATNTWTNSMLYDSGVGAGLGVLTQMGQPGASVWNGGVSTFGRVNVETNTSISYPANGHMNGQATISALLDGQPLAVIMNITGNSTNPFQWNTVMELGPGAHQLKVAALHPSGQFTAWATNYFTNNAGQLTAAIGRDAAGNVTQRIWYNTNGTTARIQDFWWDAKNHLTQMADFDTPQQNGYLWMAEYDGLGRRLQTKDYVTLDGETYIVNAVGSVTNLSFYDPQTDFLELGVASGNATQWKLCGPDLNGVYGGMNGTGGFDAVSPYLNLFDPVISDYRGNILAVETNSVVSWNPARPTAYGAVPGYRPVALGHGANVAQSSVWRGHWMDISGLCNLGLRIYDPVAGMWLSYDPFWNATDPNYLSFSGDDPVNHFDSNGKCVENGPVNAQIAINPNANLGPWLVNPGTDASSLPQPYVNPAQPFSFTSYFPNDVTFQQNVAGVAQVVDTTAQVAGVVVPFVLTDGASAVAEEETADEIVAADTSGAVASTEATTAASTSRTMTVNPDPYQIGTTPDGANTATDPNILSGHGALEVGNSSPILIVPEGTSITVPTELGNTISDSYGNAIETGGKITTEQFPEAAGSRTYLPGSVMPDYTLYPPDWNGVQLNILGNPTTVAVPTPLSSLISQGMGNVKWAACQEIAPK